MNTIYNEDCLETMKRMADNSIDLIFTDPPYALGSDVIIRNDGKPDYKQPSDFMDKWEMPTADFWIEWYSEAFRVLKHGGHCLLFGIDRQLLLFKYYGASAGFTEKQSLYWYFISNFPKATDLSKNLDKKLGKQRETIKKRKEAKVTKNCYGNYSGDITVDTPNSEIAKKYDGYKYSIAPLKQTNETIMVFQKPYKIGSCMRDVIALENGDNDITCGALDIERNRVGTETNHQGRFPSQTFLSTETAKLLDKKSGITKGIEMFNRQETVHHSHQGYKRKNRSAFTHSVKNQRRSIGDIAGCSKACHITPYEKGDFDIYNYSPKVSPKERNRGVVNNHPTVKPLRLLRQILSYFNTPNNQVVFDAFMGSGSIGMACAEIEGMEYIGTEMNKEYFEIAQKRIQKNIDDNRQLKISA